MNAVPAEQDDTRRHRLHRRWRAVPGSVRKPLVFVVGFTLIILAGVLVVLPGPFTLPPLIAGIAVLATEFAWAMTLRRHGERVARAGVRRAKRLPAPLLALLGVAGAAGAVTTGWWLIF